MLLPSEAVGYGFIACVTVMALLWVVAVYTKDAGVVDVGWAALIGGLGLFYAVTGQGEPTRRIVLGILAGTWGFRLALYLLRDRVLGKEEDGRYQALRAYWGTAAERNFFFFFQAQAALAFVLSLTFIVITENPRSTLSGWEYLGILIWIISVAGESIADAQLARFRSNAAHKGKTCRVGFWYYSRHPNYFFEWLHWFSYALMGIGVSYGWTTWFAPVLMYLFITKLTGIPYTEKQAIKSRGEDYRRYQQSTNALIPWFPKKECG